MNGHNVLTMSGDKLIRKKSRPTTKKLEAFALGTKPFKTFTVS